MMSAKSFPREKRFLEVTPTYVNLRKQFQTCTKTLKLVKGVSYKPSFYRFVEGTRAYSVSKLYSTDLLSNCQLTKFWTSCQKRLNITFTGN